MRSPIIAIANQKGGVGKTTTAINLSACLGTAGKRVLVVDLDPQANATSGLGLEKIEGQSILGAMLGEEAAADKIKYSIFQNLYIIPGEVDMCGAEIEISKRPNPTSHLKDALEPIRESPDIDLIVLDCPPSLGIISLNAFAAADWLIVPLQCEYYALEGISTIYQLVEQLTSSGVSKMQVLGIVMTMFDGRTNLSHQVVDEVRQHFKGTVFETVIPRSTRLAEAPSFGKPIIEYDQYNAGAAAYEVLTEEVLQRLGMGGPDTSSGE